MSKKIIQKIKALLRTIVRGHVTEEEIQNLIDVGEQEGVINRDEHAMIDAVFELDDTRVREIMVPRTDMVALESNTDIHTVLETIMEAGHSRIPVYEGDVDNIVGLLYAKDLLKVWGEPADNIVLGALLRRVYFIPESKTIADLLKDFKLRRVHMAVAVDEYGGTAGIVTIEDILEEIVGEIEDEYDSTEEKSFRRLDDGKYLFDARSHIEDVEEELNVEIPRGNYDTLGGFISFKLGHVPHKGEKMSYGKMLFTVVEADATKVSEIQITLTSEEE